MRSILHLWLLSAVLGGMGNAAATVAITGEVRIDPPAATLLRGQSATLTFVITNTGDEPLEGAFASSDYRASGPASTIFLAPTAATPPCPIFVQEIQPPSGDPGYVYFASTFSPRPILPGESRQCVLRLTVSNEASGPFTKSFLILGGRGEQMVLLSPAVRFNLGESPRPIPAVSTWGLALLALLLLMLGVARRGPPL